MPPKKERADSGISRDIAAQEKEKIIKMMMPRKKDLYGLFIVKLDTNIFSY